MEGFNYTAVAHTARLVKEGQVNGFDRSLCAALYDINPMLTNELLVTGLTPEASGFNADQVKSGIDTLFSSLDIASLRCADVNQIKAQHAAYETVYQSVLERLPVFSRQLSGASRDEVSDMLRRIASRSQAFVSEVAQLLSLEESDSSSVSTELTDKCNVDEVVLMLQTAIGLASAYPSVGETLSQLEDGLAKIEATSGDYYQLINSVELAVVDVEELTVKAGRTHSSLDLLSEMLLA